MAFKTRIQFTDLLNENIQLTPALQCKRIASAYYLVNW